MYSFDHTLCQKEFSRKRDFSRMNFSAWWLGGIAYCVLSGINRASVRSPAISVKISFRFVVGREAEIQVLLPPVAV